MKVGWVSHQWPREDPEAVEANTGLLPGRWAGGAEFLQEQMREAAPEGIEFYRIDTRSSFLMELCAEVDRVVVASPESLPDAVLAELRPAVVWLMTVQQPRVGPLLEAAYHVVWASEAMRGWHRWAPDGPAIPGYFDTSAVPCRRRRNGRALWAGRNHPLKGRLNARLWALENRVDLDELTGVPRPDVLDAMGRATYFVHRPNELDPCPTTVTEALIAGCEIVTNDRVGRIPASSRAEAIEYVASLPSQFYGLL